MFVSAIDNDIAWFQVREQLLDQIIDGWTGFDQCHDQAWLLERLNELGNAVASNKLLAFGSARHQLINLVRGSVINRDGITTTFNVEGQILAHHSQTDQTKICISAHHVSLAYFR